MRYLTSSEISAKLTGDVWASGSEFRAGPKSLICEAKTGLISAGHWLSKSTFEDRSDRLVGAPVSRYYNKTNIAFIHIPKNAGTSISFHLYGSQIPHFTAQELKKFYPRSFRQWTKFAVMRDPIKRFVSAFKFISSGGIHPSTEIFRSHYAEFICGDINRFCDRFLNQYSESPISNILFAPQANFIINNNGGCLLDYVVDIADAEEFISSKSMGRGNFPKLNVSCVTDLVKYEISLTARNILEEVYKVDFEIFDQLRNAPLRPNLDDKNRFKI